MFEPSLNKGERGIDKTPKNITSDDRDPSLLFPIFIELIHLLKSNFKFFHNLAQVSQGKFSDREFGDYFIRTVTEDTKKIDLLLEGVLDYIKVSTAIKKVNTLHTFIEEVLKKKQGQLGEKNIRLFKKFEKDLPEPAVPEEQLKYILNATLQYVLTLIPLNGSIGLLTRTLVLQRETSEDRALFGRDANYVEVLIQSTGYKMQEDPFQEGPPMLMGQKEKRLNFKSVLDLELGLVEEIVKRNRGMLKLDADEKKSKTSILLKFPAERRKTVYYQPVN
jgi:hypothetical protein